MLPKQQRLLTRVDFVRVQKTCRKYVMHHCILQVARQPAQAEVSHFRVGFTVTKRCGNAVVRNRIRRRLRAAIDEISQELTLPPLDIVVIGRMSTASCHYKELLRDLRYGFRKALQS